MGEEIWRQTGGKVDPFVQSAGAAASSRVARRLAKEEGIFAGTSSGANVLPALQVAKRLGPAACVVTVMVDSGLKYLGTDVYRSDQHRACPRAS